MFTTTNQSRSCRRTPTLRSVSAISARANRLTKWVLAESCRITSGTSSTASRRRSARRIRRRRSSAALTVRTPIRQATSTSWSQMSKSSSSAGDGRETAYRNNGSRSRNCGPAGSRRRLARSWSSKTTRSPVAARICLPSSRGRSAKASTRPRAFRVVKTSG